MATRTKSKRVTVDAPDIIISGSEDIELDDVLEEDFSEDEYEEVVAVKKEEEAPKPKKRKTSAVVLHVEDDPEVMEIGDVGVSGIEALITGVEEDINFPTWLFYGKNGTGKTTLASTVDGALIFAIEDGTLSIRHSKDKIKKIKITSWEQIEELYWVLERSTPKVVDGKVVGLKLKTLGGEFLVTTIVLDTLTKLAQVCLRSVALGSLASDPTKDVVNPTLRDWGTMTQKLSYWLMQYAELPVQMVWNMQEASTGETDDDEFSIYPDINKALRTFVLAQADIIGRTCIVKKDGEMKHAIKFGANPKYVTKDRTGVLGKTWINPRLDRLYTKVFDVD